MQPIHDSFFFKDLSSNLHLAWWIIFGGKSLPAWLPLQKLYKYIFLDSILCKIPVSKLRCYCWSIIPSLNLGIILPRKMFPNKIVELILVHITTGEIILRHRPPSQSYFVMQIMNFFHTLCKLAASIKLKI